MFVLLTLRAEEEKMMSLNGNCPNMPADLMSSGQNEIRTNWFPSELMVKVVHKLMGAQLSVSGSDDITARN